MIILSIDQTLTSCSIVFSFPQDLSFLRHRVSCGPFRVAYTRVKEILEAIGTIHYEERLDMGDCWSKGCDLQALNLVGMYDGVRWKRGFG